MEKELDEYLVKRYPSIFRNRHGSPDQTCMTWGFSCGNGWFFILDNLCKNIAGHEKSIENHNIKVDTYLKKIEANESVPEWVLNDYKKGDLRHKELSPVIADQVKEKFGTLRFYYSGGDEFIYGLVAMAEQMTSTTCEECGNVGKTYGGGWISTRCPEHMKKNTPVEQVNKVSVGDEIEVLDFGKLIFIKIEEIINENEVRGKLVVSSWEKPNKDKPEEYFFAKFVKNNVLSYWTAEKIIV